MASSIRLASLTDVLLAISAQSVLHAPLPNDTMGVNESRVSQIHKIALQKMAGVLQSEGIRSASAL